MKKLSLKNLTKTQTVILTVVITLLLVIILPTGIYCIVNQESVGQTVKDVFTPNEEQIIGKWQDEEGITGYEFFEDQSYDYYLSNYPITKNYHISGNELTLTDYQTNQNVVYKFRINGDKLRMTLTSTNGVDNKDPETYVFQRVDNFNLKKPVDILKELAEAAKAENEKNKNKDKEDSSEEATEEETEEDTTQEDNE